MILAHLADIHLGFRQYHRLNPHGINQREADVANVFRTAVDGVIAARCIDPDYRRLMDLDDLLSAIRQAG